MSNAPGRALSASVEGRVGWVECGPCIFAVEVDVKECPYDLDSNFRPVVLIGQAINVHVYPSKPEGVFVPPGANAA